jgi:fatty acid desaturase
MSTDALPGERPRPLGIHFDPQTDAALRRFERTSLARSTAAAQKNHTAIITIAATSTHLATTLPLVWLTVPLAWLLIARHQRALENLTHEAVHSNWHRGRGRRGMRVNDLLANVLAAYPTFSSVAGMRAGHLLHHYWFGTTRDPDLQRYNALGIERLDRANPLAFIRATARRIVPYALSWIRAIGTNPKILMASVAWHALALVIPLAFIVGLRSAVGLWACYWLLPFVLVLPWLRFAAESAKHQYEKTSTVFDATISNLGRLHRWYFHPEGDGYHVLHHVRPRIPHHQLRRAHAFLSANDAAYAGRARQRTRVFQSPGRVARADRAGQEMGVRAVVPGAWEPKTDASAAQPASVGSKGES